MSALKIIQDSVGLYVGRDTELSDLGIDSLDYLDLLLELEKQSGKDFPRSRMGEFTSVGQLADYFESNV